LPGATRTQRRRQDQPDRKDKLDRPAKLGSRVTQDIQGNKA
jgi:hypothetical protein